MDIKAEAEKIIAKVSKDGDIKEKFMKDPVGTAKSLLGDSVDKETMDKIITMVKNAVAKEGVSGIVNKVQGIVGDKLPGGLGDLLGGKKDDKKEEKKD